MPHRTFRRAALGLLAAALALGAARAQPAGRKPDVVIDGRLTRADLATYRELPFDVPAGVTRVTVSVVEDGVAAHTVLDLGLMGPHGFRGWSGSNKSSFTLSASDATPSYLPGRIDAGRWRILMGVPAIREGVTTRYQARVWFDGPGARPAVSTFGDAPVRTGPAWYRGDLHDHDAHSDGSCPTRTGKTSPCPVFLTLEAAEARGLDFIAVSDHNTTSQADALRELQPHFDDLLLIPARELTTFKGHANVFGSTEFIDFRIDGVHVRDADEMIARTHAVGGLFSISHPDVPSGEICMGCGWTAPVRDPSKIDAVEVINGGTLRLGPVDGPLSGFAFWERLLDQGLRPTAVGGSDTHNAQLPISPRQGIGSPTTVVWAQDLSEHAILDAIHAGHVFLDVEGTKTRLLEMRLTSSRGEAMMGDVSSLGDGATLTLHVRGVPGGHVQWVHDVSLSPPPPVDQPLSADDTRTVHLTQPHGRHWLYVKVHDADGRLVLVGNPIYLRPGAR